MYAMGAAGERRKLSVVISVAVLLLVAAWFWYQRSVDRQILSVTGVVATCTTRPSSAVTGWVRGYPVMAVTPLRFFSAINYGSLYGSPVKGRLTPSEAIVLVGNPRLRPARHVSGAVLSLRLQGRTEMDLHGRIVCSLGPGALPA